MTPPAPPAQDGVVRRHAYVPNATRLARCFDWEIFEAAANEMAAWKLERPRPEGRPRRAGGALIVANERMRGIAWRALMHAKYRVGETLADRPHDPVLQARLANLHYAARHIRTLAEVTGGRPLPPGKLGIVGHGGPGWSRITGGGLANVLGPGHQGRDLRSVGQDIADIALAGGWAHLDVRLRSCNSGERGAPGMPPRSARPAPMTVLDRGIRGRLTARGASLDPGRIRTHGYQGLQQKRPALLASPPATGSGAWPDGVHRLAAVASIPRRAPGGRPSWQAERERQRAMKALRHADRHYFRAKGDDVPAPGTARPGGRRMSTAMVAAAVHQTGCVFATGPRGTRLGIGVRASMFRRRARPPAG
jgi:hypothetical protein